jgi:hypothetical protein
MASRAMSFSHRALSLGATPSRRGSTAHALYEHEPEDDPNDFGRATFSVNEPAYAPFSCGRRDGVKR